MRKSSEERGSGSRPPSDSPGSTRRSVSPKSQSVLGRRVPHRLGRKSPDADAVFGMFESEDYAALVPARIRGFAEMNILLTREM